MKVIDIISGINFGLVFLFGASLSVSFSGGCKTRRDRVVLFVLYPLFLALQIFFWMRLGMDAAKQFYPLYIHLPLFLALVFGMKKPMGISLVSICAAYLCCQFPRCCGVLISALTGSALTGEIVYTLTIVLIFFILQQYFAPSARDTMLESPKSLFLFGSLPILYYIYDYTVASRFNLLSPESFSSNHIHSGVQMIAEILPTVVGLLYMTYTTAYRRQLQRRTQAELLNSLMEGQLKQAETEMVSLHQTETQAATYHHDMRHHLTAIDGFLAAGSVRQAQEYIAKVQNDIEGITPKQFCENELVNLLCSSFSSRAERMGVRLKVEAAVSDPLPISDTELCALLSNGLENALNAAAAQETADRWVEFYCGVRLTKLLIEIKNPYTGQISFQDGLPTSAQPGHGHGCRSIHAIVQAHQGLCEFSTENGLFTLRVVLSM